MAVQSTYSAIADVGVTLVELLYVGIQEQIDIKKEEIVLSSPDEAGGQRRLTVYLYQVTENSHLPNADRRDGAGDESDFDTANEPPLVLDLHYLLTAHPKQGGQSGAGNTLTTTTSEQHKLLGLAMQVLHENSILRGADLSESFSGRELHISLETSSTDELTNIWSTFHEQPLRPSITYIVTPAVIESTESHDLHRVVKRRIEEYA